MAPRTKDRALEEANRAFAERTVRKPGRDGEPDRHGIVEKIVRGRKTALLKAKCLWDDGRCTYELLTEVDVH